MPITLRNAEGRILEATEEGTLVVDIAYFDEDGAAVTPSSAAWTLTDAAGVTINSRAAVAITPATTNTIVLTGDDLAATPAAGLTYSPRRLLIAWRYSSSAGSGLYGKEEIQFRVADVAGVT